MRTILKIVSVLAIATIISSCNNGPKVIAPTTDPEGVSESGGSGIFTPNPDIQVTQNNGSAFNEDLHKVVVSEVLPTDRYVYLKVSEHPDKQFWIASRKQEVAKGEVYFYRTSLLKTNFESKEYNRVFDTIYLVSNLVAEDHSKHVGQLGTTANPIIEKTTVVKEDIPTHTDKNVEFKGAIKISELVKNPKKYEGHSVQISGKCVKVNPNIMQRNWLHIQDGSKDEFDLVVTSSSFVPEGSDITIKAIVSLNRDFGAGYRYDLILENGTLIK